jgi:hypothetical protein
VFASYKRIPKPYSATSPSPQPPPAARSLSSSPLPLPPQIHRAWSKCNPPRTPARGSLPLALPTTVAAAAQGERRKPADATAPSLLPALVSTSMSNQIDRSPPNPTKSREQTLTLPTCPAPASTSTTPPPRKYLYRVNKTAQSIFMRNFCIDIELKFTCMIILLVEDPYCFV